jgi:hypothetical protein
MNRIDGRKFAIVLGIFVGLATPPDAAADLTPILDSPDEQNEPNLFGVNPFPGNPNPSILETVYGEQNLRRVDDLLDRAFRHTGDEATAKAIARFNNPSIEEQLTFFNPDLVVGGFVLRFDRMSPGGFPLGYNPATIGSGLIPRAMSGDVFELRISSRSSSNRARNDFGQDKMVTFEIIGTEGHPENQIGNFVVGWEYFGIDDFDFQDVVFELGGVIPVPEPATWLLAASALVGLPRCRKRY